MRDEFDTAQTLQLVGFAGAGVLLTTSVVLWLFDGDERPPYEDDIDYYGLGCVPAVGAGQGLLCTGRF